MFASKKTAFAGMLLAAAAMAFTGGAGTAIAESGRPAVETPLSDVQPYVQSIRLAYVVSPSASTDKESLLGLQFLSGVLTQKTNIEPGDPVALDLERPDLNLSFFPFIYWPIVPGTKPLSPAAQEKVQRYIDQGAGVILFDMQDSSVLMGDSEAHLHKILGKVQFKKPLVPMNSDHTLTRTFYLKSMIGTKGQDYRTILVEDPSAENGRENVSSVIIEVNRNWAGTWAGTTVVDGMTREMGLRAGINMVHYALTGDYKRDQIHIKKQLEQLGH